ncbi:MAG: hypothetical protein ACXWPM_07455 [Bdellovibrionota bacterium]
MPKILLIFACLFGAWIPQSAQASSCHRAIEIEKRIETTLRDPLMAALKSEKFDSYCAHSDKTSNHLYADAGVIDWFAKNDLAPEQFGRLEAEDMAWYFRLLAGKYREFCKSATHKSAPEIIQDQGIALLHLIEWNIDATGRRLVEASCGVRTSNEPTAGQILEKNLGPETPLGGGFIRTDPKTGESWIKDIHYFEAPREQGQDASATFDPRGFRGIKGK